MNIDFLLDTHWLKGRINYALICLYGGASLMNIFMKRPMKSKLKGLDFAFSI